MWTTELKWDIKNEQYKQEVLVNVIVNNSYKQKFLLNVNYRIEEFFFFKTMIKCETQNLTTKTRIINKQLTHWHYGTRMFIVART